MRSWTRPYSTLTLVRQTLIINLKPKNPLTANFTVNDSNLTEMVTHKVFEFEELEFIAVTAYQVKKVSLVHSKKHLFRIR